MNGPAATAATRDRVAEWLVASAWFIQFIGFGGVPNAIRGAGAALVGLSLLRLVLNGGLHSRAYWVSLGLAGLALPAAAWLLLDPWAVDTHAESTSLWLAELVAAVALVHVSGELARRVQSVRVITRWALAAAAVVAFVPAAHLVFDQTWLFGMFPEARSSGPATLPLVNPNHTAALCNLFLPLALAVVRWPITVSRTERLGAALASFGLIAVCLATQSTAGIGIMGALVLALLWRDASWQLRIAGLVSAPVVLLTLMPLLPLFGRSDGTSRLTIWRTGLQMLGDHPWLGVGPGNFGERIPPYRTDAVFIDWVHAHSEPVQWLLEAGVVGLLSAAFALWFTVGALRPTKVRRRARHLRFALIAGLVGLAVHTLVDFPLRIPAITTTALICLGGLTELGLRAPDTRRRWPLTRPVALGLALATLLGSLWTLRAGAADLAEKQATRATDPSELRQQLARLERLAPWRPSIGQANLALAERVEPPERALDVARSMLTRWPDAPRLLRMATQVAYRAGAHDDAEAWLDAALAHTGYDWRLWVLKARLARERGDMRGGIEAWARAFACDAPRDLVDEAFNDTPIPLLWIDALADARRQGVLSHFAQRFKRAGAPQEAALVWDVAYSRDPSRLVGHPAYIRALRAAGRLDDALRQAEQAVTRSEQSPKAVRELRSLLIDLGRDDEALELLLDAAIQRSDLREEALIALYQAKGLKTAEQQARAWTLLGASAAGVYRGMAAVHRAEGDASACASALARSRSLEPPPRAAPDITTECADSGGLRPISQ